MPANVTSIKFQPQITSLLIGVQNKDPRLYDLLHAMINNSDEVTSSVNRLVAASAASGTVTPASTFFETLYKISLRI